MMAVQSLRNVKLLRNSFVKYYDIFLNSLKKILNPIKMAFIDNDTDEDEDDNDILSKSTIREF